MQQLRQRFQMQPMTLERLYTADLDYDDGFFWNLQFRTSRLTLGPRRDLIRNRYRTVNNFGRNVLVKIVQVFRREATVTNHSVGTSPLCPSLQPMSSFRAGVQPADQGQARG